MVSHVDVVRVTVLNRVLRQLHNTLIVLHDRNEGHTDARQHEKLHHPQKRHLLQNVCTRHVLCLHH